MEKIPTFQYDGRVLFRGAGCYYCHRIGEEGGEVGPALTHIARKMDRDRFLELLRDPASVMPGGTMPDLLLTEEQVQALANYLITLR
jgi:cytochrome c oxidase subunit 2